MDKMVDHATKCLAIGAAGFVGALARYGIALVFNSLVPIFPLGTLVINLSGSFALGWFATAAGKHFDVSESVRLAVVVGFLGAYTTFSSLMFDSDFLFRQHRESLAILNLVGSFALGMVCVRLGVLVAGR